MQTPKGSLQSGACVLVHPTQRSRDLDPETKRCSSFIGASGPWDTQKLHSRVSPHAGGRLNYTSPYRIHLTWPISLVRIGVQFWWAQSRVTLFGPISE